MDSINYSLQTEKIIDNCLFFFINFPLNASILGFFITCEKLWFAAILLIIIFAECNETNVSSQFPFEFPWTLLKCQIKKHLSSIGMLPNFFPSKPFLNLYHMCYGVILIISPTSSFCNCNYQLEKQYNKNKKHYNNLGKNSSKLIQ